MSRKPKIPIAGTETLLDQSRVLKVDGRKPKIPIAGTETPAIAPPTGANGRKPKIPIAGTET